MNSYTLNNIRDNSSMSDEYTDSPHNSYKIDRQSINDISARNVDIYYSVDVDCFYDILLEGFYEEDYSIRDTHIYLDIFI